jgi:hypothetical protein
MKIVFTVHDTVSNKVHNFRPKKMKGTDPVKDAKLESKTRLSNTFSFFDPFVRGWLQKFHKYGTDTDRTVEKVSNKKCSGSVIICTELYPDLGPTSDPDPSTNFEERRRCTFSK